MILTLYVLGLLALAIHAPPLAWTPHVQAFALVLGVLTAWSAGWGALHLVRAVVFRRRRFPALRSHATGLAWPAARPRHLYVVVTSFGTRAEITARVFQSVIDEAVRFEGPATIVACLVEPADERLIKRTFQELTPPDEIRLIFVRRPALGRRHALAAGLRAVARAGSTDDAAVVLMTGDTLLPRATFERTLPFLKSMPEVDVILTDERGIGTSGPSAAWLALRRAERHQMMSSMALSRTLDCLDGGLAIFRADVFINAKVIERIDGVRSGRAKPERFFGAGELVWLLLLESGRRMLYLPDVVVVRVDGRPRSFVRFSAAVVRRRCRTMLRITWRAWMLQGLPPAAFIRIRLQERAISAVLPVAGLLAAVAFAVLGAAALLWAYLVWLGTVRLLQILALSRARPRLCGLWPLLAEYDRTMTAGFMLLGWLQPHHARQTCRPVAGIRPGPVVGALLQGIVLALLMLAIAVLGEGLDLPPLAAPAPAR